MSEKTTVTLCVVSHTNIGKTTLARTLLRRDIGEVRDSAHVTLDAVEYSLLETPEARLAIWDTPGFGGAHAAKLLARLRREGTTAGWLLHEVVDRFADRSLYSSVEAARAMREHADVVLYLVNAREQPQDAGYVRAELDLVEALDIPAIIVINQVDPPGEQSSVDDKAVEAAWRREYGEHNSVREVLILDAFSRTWMDELRLFDAVASALPREDKAAAIKLLREEHAAGNDETIRDCSEAASELLHFASKQTVPSEGSDKRVFADLYGHLQSRLDEYVDRLMTAYSLEARNSPALQADIEQVRGLVSKKLSEATVGWLSAAVTGAGGGLAADAMSGGLTFGGGAVIGFVLGGLGGLLAARGVNILIRGDETARWSPEFLVDLFRQSLFLFLLVAHHGRGKGLIDFDKRTAAWQSALEQAVAEHKDSFLSTVSDMAGLSRIVEQTARNTLDLLYPESR